MPYILKLRYSTFLFLILLGCSNLYLNKIEGNKATEYDPTSPYFKINSYYKFNHNESPQLFITGEIVYSSLNFKNINNRYISDLSESLIIKNKGSDSLLINESNNFSLEADNIIESRSEKIYRFRKSFKVEPAEYQITYSLLDRATSKTSSHNIDLVIPSLTNERLILGDIQIYQKRKKNSSTEFIILSDREIQNKNDSLKFKYQVSSVPDATPINISGRIIKFESDTSIATSMSSLKPLNPLILKGINYSEYEEIHTFKRTLNNADNLDFEFGIPALSRGNYRIEIEGVTTNGISNNKEIDFSIKSSHFPAILSAKEKAKSIRYLITDNQYKELISIQNDTILDNTLDEFWIKEIGDPTIAKIMMNQYYSRVAEANRRYSNFKEGWKTDLGMVYILFGEPNRVQRNVNTLTWSYTDNLNDLERIYNFETPKQKNKFYPFDNYILIRSDDYFNIQYQQIQKWLNALIPIKI